MGLSMELIDNNTGLNPPSQQTQPVQFKQFQPHYQSPNSFNDYYVNVMNPHQYQSNFAHRSYSERQSPIIMNEKKELKPSQKRKSRRLSCVDLVCEGYFDITKDQKRKKSRRMAIIIQ